MRQIAQRVMHIDMDAFFASVEQAKNPHLQNRPVVVGGGPNGRGVVTAASYEAREYGIHSAMNSSEAHRRCPDAAFVGGTFAQYRDISKQLVELFEEFSPRVEAVSIDEAFLDVTGCERIFESEEALAAQMKQCVRTRFSISCSVGVAPNRSLAKLASSVFKPDGLTILQPADLPHVIYPLPVEKLSGIGPVALKRFHAWKLRTLGDLVRAQPYILEQVLGKRAERVRRTLQGESLSTVVTPDERADEKSVGHECTLSRDTADPMIARATLRSLADRVARRLRRYGFCGRTITLKCRYSDFSTHTRQTTLPHAIDSSSEIFSLAERLLTTAPRPGHTVRLLGISVSHLTTDGAEGVQCELPLDNSVSGGRARTDDVMDAIRNRFGDRAIRHALTAMGDRPEQDHAPNISPFGAPRR